MVAGIAQAQTTTAISGTFKDGSGSLITSGQVAFFLQPGIDTTMSGFARFVPTEVDCAISGSGTLSGCTLTQNTAITSPSGTSWKACVQPQFIQPGSCFVFYAIGSTLDISTTPATPPLTPAYSLVDTFSNQSISGTKNFLGNVTFAGTLSLGAISLSGTLAAQAITTTGITSTGDYLNTALAVMKWGSSGTTSVDTGISRTGAGQIGVGTGAQGAVNGVVQAGRFDLASGGNGTWGLRAGFFDQISTGGIGWSSGANATTGIDSGITRGGAAATLAIGNGTAGNASGTLKVATLNNGSALAVPATGANLISDTATQNLTSKTIGDALPFTETTAPAGSTGKDIISGDSTDHMLHQNNNNGGNQQIPIVLMLTAQYTNSTTGFTTVGTPNLAFPVAANRNYTATCHIYYQAAATGGLNIQFTGPAAPTAVTIGLNLPLSSTTFATGVVTAFGSSVGAAVTTATTNWDAVVSLGLLNGVNAGTVTLQAKSSAAAQLQIQAGSYCIVQ